MEYEDELERMRNRRRRQNARHVQSAQNVRNAQNAQNMREQQHAGNAARPRREAGEESHYIHAGSSDGAYMRPFGSAIQDRRHEDGYGYEDGYQKGPEKKKRRFWLFKLVLLLAALAAAYLLFQYKQRGTGYWTVAIFGVDSRDGKLEKGALSDVEMVCAIDRKTGDIKLVSVFRDTYLEINPDGTFHKINEAYFKGGHSQAVLALERNLDLSIDDYATFNWKAVVDAINILGGIDLEISDGEFKYINSFITETVNSTGIGSYQLERAGMNHLDGIQAVAYARLRLMDTDYNRTARQRLVIQLAMNKAKEADLKTLTTLVRAVLPQLSTSIGVDDLLPMAKNIRKYHIAQNGGFPFSRGEALIGKKDCVIPLTLESNVVQLHQLLYGTENFQPSATVKQISAKIASDSGMGEVAQNAPEAKILGQRALEYPGAGEGAGEPPLSDSRAAENPAAEEGSAPATQAPPAPPAETEAEPVQTETFQEPSAEETSGESNPAGEDDPGETKTTEAGPGQEPGADPSSSETGAGPKNPETTPAPTQAEPSPGPGATETGSETSADIPAETTVEC